ncbi:hypothetical protein F8M41_021771 [Gigaspora margarita]|uniref:Uncharacterized protein n=1 Tax=Gigaspora margarita TaxID=4874 RepID=A0A8H4B1C8_GIGMA|nr:hypothetical protein F8M41_021771 [Gigaspora margarita]
MATLYRNDTNMDSIIPWRSMTQETVTTSSTSISSIEKTDEIKKYHFFWWKTGNIHPKASLPYVLETDVTLDEYITKTDKYNVKGLWEWENGSVLVTEIPSKFYEICVATISGRSGKEADVSIRPKGKPQVPMNEPWPSLVIKVAYAVTKVELKRKIETYWLTPNRVHDAIGINFNYIPGMCPMEMTAWYYCINNRTTVGALAPIMYEFRTVDHRGNPLNIVSGQCVINIQLSCLYDGMPPNFILPLPPLSDPISIDLFDIRDAVLNC